MRRWSRPLLAAAAALLAAGALASCSLLTSLDGLSGGADDAGPEAATLPFDGAGGSDGEAGTAADAAEAGDSAPSASTLYSSAVLSDRPLGYWRLEETSGTTAKDETGHNDGTFINAPLLGQPGIVGSLAAKLPANLKARMAVTTGDFGFLGNAPYTIELWAKPGTFADYIWFGGTEVEGGGRHGWSLLTAGDALPRYEVWASVSDGGATQVRGVYVSSMPMLQGAFTHLVVSYTGTVVNGYVNGMQTATFTTAGKVPAAGTLLWGCRGDLVGCLDDWVIDELAIYDFALAGDRAKAHYDLGK